MDDGPNPLDGTARAASPLEGRRDAWLEQRLGYLAGEQARVKGDARFRRFLRGAAAAYRRFLFTADPAHRFQCWVTIRTISAGLDQLEHRVDRAEVARSAPDGPGLGPSLTDRPH